MSGSVERVKRSLSNDDLVMSLLIQPLRPEETPNVEMTDKTARDIGLIWNSIGALAPNWNGRHDACLPGFPANRQEFWGVFAEKKHQMLPVTEQFLQEPQSCGEGKIALDLGCGNSPAIPPLLDRGWKVIAVDTSKKALEILSKNYPEALAQGRLQIIEENIAHFIPEKSVDLVLASDVFPYINPADFQRTWVNIHTCLNPGGIFIGSLFRITENELQVNQAKLLGAWLLWDRRMAEALLSSSGYTIQQCKLREEPMFEDPVCIQFAAQKPTSCPSE